MDDVLSTGYLHPGYAASFSEYGVPRELPRCRGWILERKIPRLPDYDAMGCYPLFACEDWSQLTKDLDEIGDDLVSVVLVTDPFGNYDEAVLRRSFSLVTPFKEHYVADLRRPFAEIVTKDRNQCARTSHKRGVRVEECPDPTQYIDDWMRLFHVWAEGHNVHGIRAFSRETFLRQFRLPGLVMLRAVHQDATVAIGLFAIHGDVAYAHLVAFDEIAYRLRASCALYMAGIEHLADRVRWIDWGGNAGVKDDPTDGLGQFKMGWSTGRRTAYLCGRVLNRARYSDIIKAKDVPATSYFPAYRASEGG